MDYLTDLERKGVNVLATNNSWGGGGFSRALLSSAAQRRQAVMDFPKLKRTPSLANVTVTGGRLDVSGF